MKVLTKSLKRRLPFLEQENNGLLEKHYRRQVQKEWWFWRPIALKVLSYSEAIEMSRDQLNIVNVAIDIQAEKEEAAMKKSSKK